MIEINTSCRDETLALGLYTGIQAAAVPRPNLSIARFDYTIRRQTLLDTVATVFGERLTRPVSQEHRELLKKGETQSVADQALVECMSAVQVEALMS